MFKGRSGESRGRRKERGRRPHTLRKMLIFFFFLFLKYLSIFAVSTTFFFPECEKSKDCGVCHKCESNLCVVEDEGAPCDTDKVCDLQGQCIDVNKPSPPPEPECKESADCQQCFKCVGGECKVDSGASCGTDKVCTAEGQCVDESEPNPPPPELECKESSDCKQCFKCMGGECVVNDGVPCGTDMVCDAQGQCVEDPKRDPPGAYLDICATFFVGGWGGATDSQIRPPPPHVSWHCLCFFWCLFLYLNFSPPPPSSTPFPLPRGNSHFSPSPLFSCACVCSCYERKQREVCVVEDKGEYG